MFLRTILAALLVITGPKLMASGEEIYHLGPYSVSLYQEQCQLIIFDNMLSRLLSIDYGVDVGLRNSADKIAKDPTAPPQSSIHTQVIFPDGVTSVSINSAMSEKFVEINISWVTARSGRVTDEIPLMDGVHWYGGAEVYDSTYPLEKQSLDMAPYVVNNMLEHKPYGGVQERYWLSSQKVAIVGHPEDPLWIGWNKNNRLQLKGQVGDSIYDNTWPKDSPITLRYTVLLPHERSTSLRDFHMAVMNGKFGHPTGTPDPYMLRGPIWSTWAQFKKDITQAKIIGFADDILKNGFPAGILEIDDRWATYYGDYKFEPNQFQDPKKMIQELKLKGFKVTLWVHPFVDPLSALGSNPNNSQFFVQRNGDLGPALIKWWDARMSYVVDVTNPQGKQWFLDNLKVLKEDIDLDGYKFDAGEVLYLGDDFKLHDSAVNPNTYSQHYVDMAQQLGTTVEVRVGTHTQALPLFVRILDKDSHWGYNNGLKATINSALHFSLVGYPFVLPDMVGGNAYAQPPDRQLFIRWLQANTFLPGLQLSLVPWRYDAEVVEISRKVVELRNQWADRLLKLAEESVRSGEPIMRPVWFLDESEAGLTVDNEFLVGDDLLVAPVMEADMFERQVYLPKGQWRSGIDGLIQTGPGVVTQAVPLNCLAYYTRVV